MKKSLLTFFFILSAFLAYGQNLSQQVYGTVRNAKTLSPVAEAQLVLSNEGKSFQAISDSAGNYRFEAVPPDRYQLQVSHVAYQIRLIPEVQVKASRPEILQINLQEREFLLQEAEVVFNGTGAGEIPEDINENLFTIEETQRFPASFFDPARLVRSLPEVTAANDQTNLISVHGQTPNHVGWQIEGIEILSPNHLPNAGTASDRSTTSGGGTIILSGQLMDNSSFFTGSVPASMGNSLGGLFDINLRPGSRSQYAHTLQASLLGIDLATEGPLQKEHNSSYLVNYRYSTVGLLSDFGVNFGGEAIKYQDLSFHLNWNKTNIGRISLFGLGGLSSNYLSRVESPVNWEVDKDGRQVDYRAGMGALGLNHQIPLSGRAALQSGFIYSGRFSDRTGSTFNFNLDPYETTSEDLRQELFALKSSLSLQHSGQLSSELGIAANHYRTRIEAVPGNIAPTGPLSSFDHTLSYTSLQPFGELRYKWSPLWLLTTGLRLNIDSRNEKLFTEPRLQLLRKLSTGSSLQLSYSLLSQPMLNQPNLLPAVFAGGGNVNLEPVRSHYGAIGFEKEWEGKTHLKTKGFYQYFYNAPVSPEINTFSALNTIEEYALWSLENSGTGRIYGLDASLQRYFTADYFYLLGISLFDATYEDTQGNRRNMRFNSQYNLNLTAGREWKAQKENHIRIWGAHIRTLYHGGYWYTPVNEEASRIAQTTIPDYSRAFSERLPAYYTLDIRLSHTKEKPGYQRIWSIDIQNVLNRQNIGWYYYDQIQEEVLPAYQLGLIPVLSYRIEF